MAIHAGKFQQLELKDVGRRFGDRDALQGLNLTIGAGEFIALLGPSGCGKSTALNCIAGLLPLTDGSMWIDGERFDDVPAERRGFGMVFQNYALFPHMTVRKNIAFGLEMRKTPKAEIEKRVTDAIGLVRLEEHEHKLPGQLSGGQQQRVAIARAIVLEPRLVLMDEPLSNLDAKLRLEMRGEIKRIHHSLGLTTIYVTHDQEEALSMADRLVVLRSGLVQQVGTPLELHGKPANWFVADFMGCRNLLDMTADAAARPGERIQVSGGRLTFVGEAVNSLAAGEAVKVAIRPEDLSIRDGDAQPGDIAAVVSTTEYVGREYSVNADAGDHVLHARSRVDHAPDTVVQLYADRSRVLVYPGVLDRGTEHATTEVPTAATAATA